MRFSWNFTSCESMNSNDCVAFKVGAIFFLFVLNLNYLLLVWLQNFEIKKKIIRKFTLLQNFVPSTAIQFCSSICTNFLAKIANNNVFFSTMYIFFLKIHLNQKEKFSFIKCILCRIVIRLNFEWKFMWFLQWIFWEWFNIFFIFNLLCFTLKPNNDANEPIISHTFTIIIDISVKNLWQ